ncbi:hypothetical protein AVEN_90888-1 [Araneus ventricosus]|uniref:Uncharacterized protein n=1 Tax=Araneus ventricosus TaxID=182803 RepID=A0A4Y2VR10_ARAVE|nr:hypothetical protein AVEN_90888-1 [Araneus ventricosus]
MLEFHTQQIAPISENHYGFVKGRSIVQANSATVKKIQRNKEDQQYTAMIALGTKEAFGSVVWSRLLTSIYSMGYPKENFLIIKDYLNNRWIEYPTCSGIVKKLMLRGSHKVSC